MKETERINTSPQTTAVSFRENVNENSFISLQNQNIPKGENISKITQTKQRLIFLPLVSSIITIALIGYYKYLRYAYKLQSTIDRLGIQIVFIYFMIMLSYFLAIFTSSSQTNVNKYFESFNIMNTGQSKSGVEIKNFKAEQWNFCEFCMMKKFYRASHCRICNKCILFRDHHCPWIGNCVGYQNYQYFCNFLFWAEVGVYYTLEAYLRFVISYNQLKKNKELGINVFVLIISSALLLVYMPVFIGLMNIFIRVNLVVYNNKTTLDNIKNFNIEYYTPCRNRDNKNSQHNEYNIGFLSHYYYLIGPTLFHLIFPLPKFQKLILNEESPIFAKCKHLNNYELVKYLMTVNESYKNILNTKENDPDYFIELCHKNYDGKEIL